MIDIVEAPSHVPFNLLGGLCAGNGYSIAVRR